MGAGLVIYYKTQIVVQLFGGYTDPSWTSPYNAHTLGVVFSSGKAVESILCAYLVSKGLFKYEDKISKFWPEFGANGKTEVTVADLMGHRAGVSYVEGHRRPKAEDWADLDRLGRMM